MKEEEEESVVYFRWQGGEEHFWQMLAGFSFLQCRRTCLTTSITLMDLIFPKIRREREAKGRIPFEMEEGN